MHASEIQVTSIGEFYERFDLTPIRTSLHSIHIDTRRKRRRRDQSSRQVKVIVLYPEGKTGRNFLIRLNATSGMATAQIPA